LTIHNDKPKKNIARVMGVIYTNDRSNFSTFVYSNCIFDPIHRELESSHADHSNDVIGRRFSVCIVENAPYLYIVVE